MEIVGTIVLEVTIGKSAELLLSGLQSAELEEVHKKLDALLLGDFRAACRLLADAEKLATSGRATLLDALRLFELSAGRFDVLVERHRNQLFPGFWGRSRRLLIPSSVGALYATTKHNERSSEAELLALEDVLAQLVYEYVRLLCYVGSLRVALLIDSEPLAVLKRERVRSVASEVKSFIETALSRLATSYEEHGKIDVLKDLERKFFPSTRSRGGWSSYVLGGIVQRKLVGWARGETYEQYKERLRQEYLRSLQSFDEWENLDLGTGTRLNEL